MLRTKSRRMLRIREKSFEGLSVREPTKRDVHQIEHVEDSEPAQPDTNTQMSFRRFSLKLSWVLRRAFFMRPRYSQPREVCSTAAKFPS